MKRPRPGPQRVHMGRYPGYNESTSMVGLSYAKDRSSHRKGRWSRPNLVLQRDRPDPVHALGERPSPNHAQEGEAHQAMAEQI